MTQKPIFFGALFVLAATLGTSVFVLAATLGTSFFVQGPLEATGEPAVSERKLALGSRREVGEPDDVRRLAARSPVLIDEVDIVGDMNKVAEADVGLIETEVFAIPASEWVQGRYEVGYLYDGPLVDPVASAESAAKLRSTGGELSAQSPEELKLREAQLVQHFPELAATVESVRAEREAETQRFAAAGQGPSERAMEAGVLLED